MFRILPLVSLWLLSTAVLQAAPLELFYSSFGRTYQVESFEGGRPVLNKAIDPAAHGLGERGAFSSGWTVRGDLPLDGELAFPALLYALSGEERAFKAGEEGTDLFARIAFDGMASLLGSKLDLRGKLLVYGWVHEGRVVDTVVTVADADRSLEGKLKLKVPMGCESGFPCVWALLDGRAAPHGNAGFEAFLQAGLPDAEVIARLAKYKDRSGNTGLHYAARAGRLDIAQALLEARPKLIDARNKGKGAVASAALVAGKADVLAFLLGKGAPVVDALVEKSSLLKLAVETGCIDGLETVLQGVATTQEERDDALALAFKRKRLGMIRSLVEAGARGSGKKSESFVLKHAKMGFPGVAVEYMKLHGLGMDVAERGNTLLHCVMAYADGGLLRRLVDMGLSMEAANDLGETPLHLAIRFENLTALDWILKNGYEARALSPHPLVYALERGKFAALQCLLSNGFDLDERLDGGLTPLLWTAQEGSLSLALSLVEAGAAWDFEHPAFGRIVGRLLREDEAVLLASILDQGWGLDREFARGVTLAAAAEALESPSVLALLRERGTGAGEVYRLDAVDVAPKPTFVPAVEYPIELQRRYGDLSIGARVVVAADGSVAACSLYDDMDSDIARVALGAVEAVRFSPAVVATEAVATVMDFKIQLNARSTEIDEGQVYDASEVDRMPRIVLLPDPIYPAALKGSGKKGRVVVEFLLMADGRILDLRAIESDHPGFEAPAIEAIARAKIDPAIKAGKAVACRVRLPIELAF